MKKFLSVLLSVALIITALPFGAFNLTASAATSGITGDCTWTLDGTVLTISGKGNMEAYNHADGGGPWYRYGVTKVVIQDGVTSVGSAAFYNCGSLTNITIPDSVTSIGEYAFEYTGYYSNSNNWVDKALYIGKHLIQARTSISGGYIIKDGTLTIADKAFRNCTSLTSITIPDSVTSIGSSAFEICTSLTSITIPDSVTSIGFDAFENCTSLTSITIPDSVTSIGNRAFSNCASLTNITIPDSVTSIGDRAFFNTGYYNNGDNWENSILYIGNHLIEANGTISGSYAIKDGTLTIAGFAFGYRTSLESITIPDSVTSIGDGAFYRCTSLENVYITDLNAWYNIDFSTSTSNPLYHADFLFLNNKPVTNVVVPEGVTEITPYMFDFCTLKKITLPEGVTTIGEKAFASCEILTEINIPSSVKSIDNNAFSGCESLETVNITDLNKWCEINFEGEYSNPLIYAENLYLNGEPLTDLVIPEGMTEIPSYLFSSATIKSVTMPNTVIKIGDYAFKNCSGLESISIPNSVTNIGNNAFENCTSLKRVFLGKEYMIVKNGTFKNCNNITDIYYEGTEEDWESVAILLNNGSLANAKVTFNATGLPNDSASIIGDINSDETINLKDLVTIAQYTAGWQRLTVNEAALDVNVDGRVDLDDVTYLSRHLAGWKNYSLPPNSTNTDGWTGDYIIK